jgi:hypothetical protein
VNRRLFLGTLLGTAAAAADPERMLWTPGRKLISIPKWLPVLPVLKRGDTITFVRYRALDDYWSLQDYWATRYR